MSSRCIGVEDTYSEYIRVVFPRHANPAGFLYGGYMLNWIVDSGVISILKTIGKEAVLGYMDNVYFINPVTIGSMLIYRSWIARAGKSSLDIYTEIISYYRKTNEYKIVAAAKSIYVCVDQNGRPEPHGLCIDGRESWGKKLIEYMDKWHEKALAAIEKAKSSMGEAKGRLLRHHLRTVRRVSSEDTMTSNMMYAGRLMLMLDEAAGIIASQYAGSGVVTASVDQMIFTSPIKVGDVIEVSASLTRTWRTSMEIEVTVKGYEDSDNIKTRSYFTFVKIDDLGRPEPLKPYEPVTPEEVEAWVEADFRRKSRIEDLEKISIYKGLPISYNRDYKSPYLVV